MKHSFSKLNSLPSFHNSIFSTEKSECWQCVYHFCLPEPLKCYLIISLGNCFLQKTQLLEIKLYIYVFKMMHANKPFHPTIQGGRSETT